jgi:HlyD family secretion protein
VRKSKILIPLVLVLAVAGGAWWWYEGRQPESADELVVFGNVDIREARLSFNGSEHVGVMYVDEGDQVTEGQLLARLHTERLEATRNRARAQVGVSQARAAAAESTFRRVASLADRDLASEEERDEAEAAYKAELAQVEADKAALAFAEQALGDAELYAPADGVIRERILEPGDMASPLTPVFTLAFMDPVWVRAYLPETALGKVRPGATASITTDSFPGKAYKGWIGFIAPTAEFTPKNVETTELRARLVYRMRVYACNPAGELRLGMPATVRLDLTATDTSGAAVCDDG